MQSMCRGRVSKHAWSGRTVRNITARRPGTVLAALFVMYAIMIVISVVIESFHVEMDLIALMAALSAIFSVCALFAMIVMEKDMARVSLGPPQLPAPN